MKNKLKINNSELTLLKIKLQKQQRSDIIINYNRKCNNAET